LEGAYERNYGWLGALMAEHYVGDDSNVQILPTLRLLILHDDEREFDCTPGAEQALEQAGRDKWTVVSVKNAWVTVF
jgi:hypothetical protein